MDKVARDQARVEQANRRRQWRYHCEDILMQLREMQRDLEWWARNR